MQVWGCPACTLLGRDAEGGRTLREWMFRTKIQGRYVWATKSRHVAAPPKSVGIASPTALAPGGAAGSVLN